MLVPSVGHVEVSTMSGCTCLRLMLSAFRCVTGD